MSITPQRGSAAATGARCGTAVTTPVRLSGWRMWCGCLPVLSDYRDRSRGRVVKKENCYFRSDFLTPSGRQRAPGRLPWPEVRQCGGWSSSAVPPVSTDSGSTFPGHKLLFWKTINLKTTAMLRISTFPSEMPHHSARECARPHPTSGVLGDAALPHCGSPGLTVKGGVHTCSPGRCEAAMTHT